MPAVDDIDATLTNAFCSILSTLITIVKESEPPANAVPVCMSKAVGAWIDSEPALPVAVDVPTGPQATDEATVGPGDAEAGGAATAVKMTGTVHATPATTLRRLKLVSTFSSTVAFETSDKSCPRQSVPQCRSHSETGSAHRPEVSGFALLFRTQIKFPSMARQGSLKTSARPLEQSSTRRCGWRAATALRLCV